MNEEEHQRLSARGTLQEHVFHSDIPVIGPLIARFREAWNSISTKWYVRPIIQQQNEFNGLLVSYLREMEQRLDSADGRLNSVDGRLSDVDGRLSDVDARMVDTDRDQTQLTRNVAELSYQLGRLSRLLDEMDTGQTRPENRGEASPPPDA